VDSLTHIVLGAAIADLTTGRKIGKRAMLYGAVLGTLPDMDVAIGAFMSDVDKIIFHRGITHSLLFWLVMSPVCGWLISRIESAQDVTFRRATSLSFLVLFSHAIIDAFTSYGTRLLIPFTFEAYAFSNISIIDPFYSIWLYVAVPFVLLRNMSYNSRKIVLVGALILSQTYLFLTILNKISVDRQFSRTFENSELRVSRFTSKPGLFSNLLWRGVAETENGYYIAWYSVVAGSEHIRLDREPGMHHLLEGVSDSEAIRRLTDVTQGYYTVHEDDHGRLFINDLRFGRISEWSDGDSPYAFSYEVVVSDGKVNLERVPVRFERSRDRQMVRDLLNRITGKYLRDPSQSAPEG
jgi:inner membrane protein